MDEHDVPFVLFNQLDDDRDGTSATLADTVRVLADAAGGARARPALHRMMTGSRLLTLSGARIHVVYPRYG